MPILLLSAHSLNTSSVSIPAPIPQQYVELVSAAITFHDPTSHARINNNFNTILYVRLDWITNKQSVSAKSNESTARGVAPPKTFTQGAIPLLLNTETGGNTFSPDLKGYGFELQMAIPQHFDIGIYVKDIDNNVVPFTHITEVSYPGGVETRTVVPAYCKVHMIWTFASPYTY